MLLVGSRGMHVIGIQRAVKGVLAPLPTTSATSAGTKFLTKFGAMMLSNISFGIS